MVLSDSRALAPLLLSLALHLGPSAAYQPDLITAFAAAVQTPAASPPEITEAPVLPREIVLRQATGTVPGTTATITFAPDNTCGYLSGSPGNALTCATGSTCMWESDLLDIVFCDYDHLYLNCLDRDYALNPSLCNDVCQSNTFTTRCTGTASPYCGTYVYPGGALSYRCATSRLTGLQTASHTYSGEVGRSFSVTELDLTPTSSGNDNGNSFIVDVTTTTISSRTSSIDPGPTTTTAAPGPSTNVGAIAGGTVGGVLGLGLIFLGAFWFMRRGKKKAADDATTSAANNQQPPPIQPQGPVYAQPPMSMPVYSDPNTQAYYTAAPGYTKDAMSREQSPGSPQPTMSPLTSDFTGDGMDPSHRSSMVPSMMQSQSPVGQQQQWMAPPQGYSPPQPYVQQGYAPPQGYAPQGQEGVAYPPAQYPQQGPIIEADSQPVDHHRGQIHELR